MTDSALHAAPIRRAASHYELGVIFEIWCYLISLCESVSGVRPRAR